MKLGMSLYLSMLELRRSDLRIIVFRPGLAVLVMFNPKLFIFLRLFFPLIEPLRSPLLCFFCTFVLTLLTLLSVILRLCLCFDFFFSSASSGECSNSRYFTCIAAVVTVLSLLVAL